MKKEDARKIGRQRRNALSAFELYKNSEIIADKVVKTKEFQQATRIMIYKDCKNEVQTGEIIAAARKLGKKVAFPRVTDGGTMLFYDVEDENRFEKSQFGILEPVDGYEVCENDFCESLMIVPGVAFDRNCRRVGYGGGYYDRYLEHCENLTTIAVAFSCQIVENIEVEEKDVAPQCLITEKDVFYRIDNNL